MALVLETTGPHIGDLWPYLRSLFIKDVPAWANRYIGYLYANNLTNGVSAEFFGSNNPIDSKSYATYLLRSLGYDDKQGDFSWKDAVSKSVEVGILTTVDPKFYVVLRKPLKIDIFAEPTKNSSSYSYILTLFTPLPQHI